MLLLNACCKVIYIIEHRFSGGGLTNTGRFKEKTYYSINSYGNNVERNLKHAELFVNGEVRHKFIAW